MAKADTFTDDFTAIDWEKWWGYDTEVDVSGGALQLIATDAYYPYLESAVSWDLTDSYFAFELVSNSTGLSVSTELRAEVSSGNYVSVIIDGGTSGYVTFRETVGSVNSDSAVTFDPSRHKWFRIRDTAGEVTWETSIDGGTWVVRRTKSTSLDLSAVVFRFTPGYWGTEPSPGVTVIDNVNLNSGTAIGWDTYFAADFTDPFTSENAINWFYPEGGGFVVSGGYLQCVPAADYPYVVSNHAWDMTNSGFTIQLVQNASAGTGTITSEFLVRIDVNNALKFIVPGGSSGQLILREVVSGTNSDLELAFNPDLHKWFRIRQDSGSVFWEVSRDGATWSILRSKSASFAVTALHVMVTTGFYGTESSPGTVKWDNLNLPNLSRLREIGWYTGTALPFGGIDTGTVQQRTFFEDADWLWSPIPPDPVLDDLSDDMVEELATGYHTVNAWDFGVTIVKPSSITEVTPRYTFALSNFPAWGPHPLGSDEVPVPGGTQIPPGSDGHLVVMDPVNRKVYSFWQAYESGGVWHASWAGVSEWDGDGIDYEGNATATELSRLAAVVLLNEIRAGEIAHALFFASDMAGPTFRYPATKSDGVNLSGSPITIPEGARVQLDPSIDLSAIAGITPGELAVGRALQRYGAYCGDQGGSRMGFIFEFEGGVSPGASYSAAGFGWDYFDMTHIPWDSLRVLKNWDGSA